jgi:hypothetical protein
MRREDIHIYVSSLLKYKMYLYYVVGDSLTYLKYMCLTYLKYMFYFFTFSKYFK